MWSGSSGGRGGEARRGVPGLRAQRGRRSSTAGAPPCEADGSEGRFSAGKDSLGLWASWGAWLGMWVVPRQCPTPGIEIGLPSSRVPDACVFRVWLVGGGVSGQGDPIGPHILSQADGP